MNRVKLITSDNKEVQIEEDVISKSILIKSLIDDAGADEAIPLPNIKKDTLDYII